MNRRIYFLSPDVEHAESVVRDLEHAGIAREDMHSLAKDEIDISSLPEATEEQKHDRVWFLDRMFWLGDLAIFTLALLMLVLTIYWGFYIWSAVALSVMIITFVLGEIFATRIPHVHLTEVKGALARGEILLMVDVPKSQIHEISELVTRRHPETDSSGVGWTIGALGT